MKKQISGLVSARKSIDEIDYTTALPTIKRDKALEEALHDLEKSPEQLLVDTHDESLAPLSERARGESITRVLARMASMQLKIERAQTWTNRLLFVFALLSLFFGGVQAYFTVWPRATAASILRTVPTLQSPQLSDQSRLLIPLAPMPPLQLEIRMAEEAKEEARK